ncbi:unnamed protein product [Prunus brigantina]
MRHRLCREQDSASLVVVRSVEDGGLQAVVGNVELVVGVGRNERNVPRGGEFRGGHVEEGHGGILEMERGVYRIECKLLGDAADDGGYNADGDKEEDGDE